MFRPAGFSDSEDSDQGFSSRKNYSSDEEQKSFSLRRARGAEEAECQGNTIPWDMVNNNTNNNDESLKMASNDTTVSNPDLAKLLEKTKKYLRSTLLSHKGGVEIHALDSDYYELVGERIPYARLNFDRLEALLRALPTVCSLWRGGGQVMVKGVAGEASQHIQNMVAMQKTTMKARKRGKGKKGGRNGRSNYEMEMDSWHRQFAPPPPPSVRTKKAPPAPSTRTFKAPPTKQQAIPAKNGNAKVVSDLKGGTKDVRGVETRDLVLCGDRVRELLHGRQHGLYIAQVEKIYWKRFNESLPVDWAEKLKAVGDIIVVKEDGGLVLVKSGEGRRDAGAAATADHNVDISNGADARSGNQGVEEGKLEDRVLELLQGRVYGLLVPQVEKMYTRQWGQKLEGEWVGKLEELGGIEVDRQGEQVLLRVGSNGIRNIPASPLSGLDRVVSGVDRLTVTRSGLEVRSVGRRDMVDKVRQVERVKQLLQGRVHGLYATQVEKMYEKKYSVTLASTWWSELVEAARVEVEMVQSGQVVVRWTQVENI